MGTTVPSGFPFPEATDQPYVHLDLKALAEALEAKQPRAGTATVNASSSYVGTIKFDRPLPTTPRAVVVTIMTGSAKVSVATARADTFAPDGFRLILNGMSPETAAVAVSYVAVP